MILFTAATPARADVCNMPDTGGTTSLPLDACEYASPFDRLEIVQGLPLGTTIEIAPVLDSFQCNAGSFAFCSAAITPGICEVAGGTLGGTLACSKAELQLTMSGTGLLAGFNRVITMLVDVETHHGARSPSDPVQAFQTQVFYVSGDVSGDPDFDLLELRAGSAFGYSSPGVMELFSRAGVDWRAEERLDLGYSLGFIGAPGSILEGLSGTTTSRAGLEVGTNACIAPDSGIGTVELPPGLCDYVNEDPQRPYEIFDGLPPGTTIVLEPVHEGFFCPGSSATCSVILPPGQCETPGGSLGGSVSCHESEVRLDVRGTGLLLGFERTLFVPLVGEFHTGPRNPGDQTQLFPQAVQRWEGEILGDPDFCTFRFRAGDAHGLSSPGIAQLVEQPGGGFSIDSFFDLTYQIEFQGCTGSAIEGFGGTTQGMIPITIGNGPATDAVPGLTGGWLALAAALLGISSVWVLREKRTRD